MFKLIPVILATALFPAAVHSFEDYDNGFVNVTYMAAKNFPNTTLIAQNTIMTWADQFAELGPWSEFILLKPERDC